MSVVAIVAVIIGSTSRVSLMVAVAVAAVKLTSGGWRW